MTCVICKNGETEPGVTTSTLERDSTILFIKDIPAKVCNNCGEAYIDSQTLVNVHNMSPENSERDDDVDVVVLKYPAQTSNGTNVHIKKKGSFWRRLVESVPATSVRQSQQKKSHHEATNIGNELDIFLRELGLAPTQYEKAEHNQGRGGYRLYVPSSSKRRLRFGYARINVEGTMIVYANGDFSDPEGRFTAQRKNNYASYKFWPGNRDAMRYAAKVVRSAYESKA